MTTDVCFGASGSSSLHHNMGLWLWAPAFAGPTRVESYAALALAPCAWLAMASMICGHIGIGMA